MSEGGPSNTELMQQIFTLFADELEFYSTTGVVQSIDTTNKTCVVSPDNGDPDIQYVKYVVKADSSLGIQIEPKVGSQVCVSFLGNNNGVITKIQEFEVFTFDGGSNTVAVAEKVVTRLNLIEDALANIVDAISNAGTTGGDGGAAFKAAILIALASNPGKVIPQSQDTDINYDKIKLP